MNAQEMFEKLGFEKVESKTDDERFIRFEILDSEYNYIIVFDLEFKDLYVQRQFMDLRLLKAITQQMKELGWL